MVRRLELLEDITFPVELQPLFTRFKGREVPVRDSLAVVHSQGSYPLGVVSKEYRLITNGEALDFGIRCSLAAFPETRPDEWTVAAVDAPSTGSYCFIDLAHNSAALDFSGVPADRKPDAFGPFVRVTNSYNRTRALRFDIGYFRKVCRNGLILQDTLIHFSLNHQKRRIGEQILFEIDQDKLTKDREAFQKFLRGLLAIEVQESQAAVITEHTLGFKAPSRQVTASQLQAWMELRQHVSQTCRRYIQEGGANAYALMNAITDLSSRPPASPHVRRDKHSLQKRAGAWLADFVTKAALPQFDVSQYIKDLNDSPRKTEISQDVDRVAQH